MTAEQYISLLRRVRAIVPRSALRYDATLARDIDAAIADPADVPADSAEAQVRKDLADAARWIADGSYDARNAAADIPEPTGVLMHRRLQGPTDLCENEWYPWEEVFAPDMTIRQPETYEYAWFKRSANLPVQPTYMDRAVDGLLKAEARRAHPAPVASDEVEAICEYLNGIGGLAGNNAKAVIALIRKQAAQIESQADQITALVTIDGNRDAQIAELQKALYRADVKCRYVSLYEAALLVRSKG